MGVGRAGHRWASEPRACGQRVDFREAGGGPVRRKGRASARLRWDPGRTAQHLPWLRLQRSMKQVPEGRTLWRRRHPQTLPWPPHSLFKALTSPAAAAAALFQPAPSQPFPFQLAEAPPRSPGQACRGPSGLIGEARRDGDRPRRPARSGGAACTGRVPGGHSAWAQAGRPGGCARPCAGPCARSHEGAPGAPCRPRCPHTAHVGWDASRGRDSPLPRLEKHGPPSHAGPRGQDWTETDPHGRGCRGPPGAGRQRDSAFVLCSSPRPPRSGLTGRTEAKPGGTVRAAHLSKMAPTPALWALFRWTCSPVARRIPSFTAMDRWEKEAMSSSFQPGGGTHGHSAVAGDAAISLRAHRHSKGPGKPRTAHPGPFPPGTGTSAHDALGRPWNSEPGPDSEPAESGTRAALHSPKRRSQRPHPAEA